MTDERRDRQKKAKELSSGERANRERGLDLDREIEGETFGRREGKIEEQSLHYLWQGCAKTPRNLDLKM